MFVVMMTSDYAAQFTGAVLVAANGPDIHTVRSAA